MSDPTLTENEALLTAYFDGELQGDEAKQAEQYLAEHPEAAAAQAEFALSGSALRSAAETWEAGVAFENFSAGVMARLPDQQPAAETARSQGAGPMGLWHTFSVWLAGHPALAAAATIMVVLGAGSVLYLNGPGSPPGPLPGLELHGAATQIQDLSFGSGSAVVYKTDADVTVIWLTEDDAP